MASCAVAVLLNSTPVLTCNHPFTLNLYSFCGQVYLDSYVHLHGLVRQLCME